MTETTCHYCQKVAAAGAINTASGVKPCCGPCFIEHINDPDVRRLSETAKPKIESLSSSEFMLRMADFFRQVQPRHQQFDFCANKLDEFAEEMADILFLCRRLYHLVDKEKLKGDKRLRTLVKKHFS